MTIKEIIEKLKTASPEIGVYYSALNCVPTTVDSWRGIYAEPAIGWSATGYSGEGRAPSVASLISELEKSTDGRIYSGWKGGEYSYSKYQTLHVDNSGDWTQTEITSVEVTDRKVIIHIKTEN